MATNIIPLSPQARFLATQLSSQTQQPRIILPKHLLKPFLIANSTITYTNQISPLNAYQQSFSYPAASTNYLKHVSTLGISATEDKRTKPLSLVIPSSQLTPIFDLKVDSKWFIPPPNSDVVVLNPYWGQIEKLMSLVMPEYIKYHPQSAHPPRFWAAVSTHQLENSTFWGVRHKSVGEMKIANIPYKRDSYTHSQLKPVDSIPSSKIDASPFIKQLLCTPTLVPQLYSYNHLSLLLSEQTVLESAFRPFLKLMKLARRGEQNLNDTKAKSIVFGVVSEAVAVLQQDPGLLTMAAKNPAVNSTLSPERLFNEVINIANRRSSAAKDYNVRDKFFHTETLDTHAASDTFEGSIGDPKAYMRDEFKANRLLISLGKLYGVETPTNKFVCDLLDSNAQNHK